MAAIIIYGVDILKSLFTGTPGFEMANKKKRTDYLAKEGKAEDDEDDEDVILMVGKASWRWMSAHNLVKTREWQGEMITDVLMNDLDAAFGSIFSERDYHFVVDSATWMDAMDDYQTIVDEKVTKQIVGNTWAKEEQQAVRDQIKAKVEWIFHPHRDHFSPPLPLMTVSTIRALATTFQRVSLAIREVSSLIIL